MNTSVSPDYDVVVVGAGFSGLYLLHRLRTAGFAVRVFEAGAGVGGTWYWNRYPGARCDSECSVYCFSDLYSQDLLARWEWKERYPSQPEVLTYLNWVADELSLRDAIELSTRVTGAEYDESTHSWTVRTDRGEPVTCSYFVPAVGVLSKPNIPSFEGLDSFHGEWFHTARLPKAGVDYRDKNVAIIGNGATAIQLVPEVAKQAKFVRNFIRTPYHSIPGRNDRLTAEDWQDIHQRHRDIWRHTRNNVSGHPYAGYLGNTTDYSAFERDEVYKRLWYRGGFPLAISSFEDVYTNPDANATVMDFLRRRISLLVDDPEVADILTPKDMFGGKRTPIEHGYYSAFNRANVGVVDLKRTPIERFTATGLQTSSDHFPVDVAFFATGFDAYTGSLLEMDIRGPGGTLREEWQDEIHSFLGLMVPGFPNMFMLYCGPYNPAILTNGPTLIEQQGEWIVGRLSYLRQTGLRAIQATQGAEEHFMREHDRIAGESIISQTASWWTGSNVEGKPKRLLSWVGGFPSYRDLCDAAVNDDAAFDAV
jgi:cation diffusion facilitator CzcD-associated flavoprotein CzcO